MAGSKRGTGRAQPTNRRLSPRSSRVTEPSISRSSTGEPSPDPASCGTLACMDEAVPARVREYADQTVNYVRNALGVTLEYDSNTLPLLDHYLRNVPDTQPATLQLVVATSGAYFG